VRGTDSSNYGQYTNLFSSSTVAIDADTGKLAWYYQSTPHDAWDYDGVNENVLADVDINGQKTPLLFKADRNGFFYVLNRKTGQLISAKLFATANWTSGMDMSTGRPIEVPEKRPRLNFRAKDVCPSAIGNKNWMPMSYSPQTGLVYMPTLNICAAPSISAPTSISVNGVPAVTSARSSRGIRSSRKRCGATRIRCRTSAASPPPPAGWSSMVTSTAGSRRSTPRPDKRCGSS
jgi:glucose dehydrogenase